MFANKTAVFFSGTGLQIYANGHIELIINLIGLYVFNTPYCFPFLFYLSATYITSFKNNNMKKIFALLICLAFISNAFSQTTPKEKKIKEMLELVGSGKLGVQVAQQMLNNFQERFTSVPAEFWEKMKASINADDLINLTIPVYAKYYTEEDLDQIVAFYKTPAGRKVISVTPQIVQESMMLGREWGQKLGEKILSEMKASGYDPEKIEK